MGARNFNFASKVPQNGGFPALKCRVLNVNFSDKERNCQQFFNSSKFKEQCPPRLRRHWWHIQSCYFSPFWWMRATSSGYGLQYQRSVTFTNANCTVHNVKL